MLKRHLTSALRHLWRQRLFTSLNIIGLAIGISGCWVIYRIARYEFSYESNIPGKQNIYRVVSGFIFDGKESFNGGVSIPVYQALRKEAPGLQRVVPLSEQYIQSIRINNPDGGSVSFDDEKGIEATDPAYFSLVPYQWLAGNKTTALTAPEDVVLTESRARAYFPGKTPQEILNRTITYFSWDDTATRTVKGIVADLKGPTEFVGQEFCVLPEKTYPLVEWTNTNGSDKLYLQTQPNTDPATVLATIGRIADQKSNEFEASKKFQKAEQGFRFKRWFELLPLNESHFATYIEERGVHKISKKVLYGLISIALFLLLLACINYINMGIASIPQRAKEIGVRKTLGSSPSALIGQFLRETFLTTVVAASLGYVLGLGEFALLRDIIPEGVRPMEGIRTLLAFTLVVSLFVTVLSGLYPGWLITKVRAASVFRHAAIVKSGGGRISLQKTLIVLQFVVAIVFISSALIMGRQLNYAIHSDMGFNKDAVILVRVPWKYSSKPEYKDKQFALLSELKAIPGIAGVAMGTEPLSASYNSGPFEYTDGKKEPVSRSLFRKRVDSAYLGLYGFHVLAGRPIRSSDTTNEYMLNETAVKALGFASPQDALGKLIGQRGDKKFPVVGVVGDFHSQNFYAAIDPIVFMANKSNLLVFDIKLQPNTGNWPRTISAIEKRWNAFYPSGSFTYQFYDESIAALYKDERHLARLIDLSTGIAILLSCLGLFGLAALTAHQRTREIGIRKVLGASVAGVVGLLSKEYLRLVSIALVLATPITWWAMHRWLQNFIYRISLQWWMFALAGVMAIAAAFLTVGFLAWKAARVNPVKSLKTE